MIAHSDGGARGNPGPAGYGVVVQDQAGTKVAALSQYLGHQTNNFAEYQGLIAALEYAIEHGHKALKVISDSELLVRQIKGIYKVKNATLQELHGRAKQLIAQLDWFSIDHALREHNREADDLANQAMDKGTGRAATPSRVTTPTQMAVPGRVAAGDSPATASSTSNEFEGGKGRRDQTAQRRTTGRNASAGASEEMRSLRLTQWPLSSSRYEVRRRG